MIVYPVSFMSSNLWQFSSTPLTWPSSTTGYTQFTGGIVSNAYSNGIINGSLFLGFQFQMASSSSVSASTSSISISTNGQFRITPGAVDLTNDKPSIPPVGGAPLYYLNAGGPTGTAAVNTLEPGAPLFDGDTQSVWSRRSASDAAKLYFDAIVFSGIAGDPAGISSYMFSLYKDRRYQWMVTRTKTTPNSTFAGPYNPSTDVSQTASTTSRVWRVEKVIGGAIMFEWEYMGTGSVIE